MSYQLAIPFYTVKLNFANSGSINTPLLESEVMRVEYSASRLANEFANAFQNKILDKGGYASLLNYLAKDDFKTDTVKVEFQKISQKGMPDRPGFELEFKFLYQENERGYWACIPALALEVFAPEKKEVKSYLRNSVKLEFARKQRMRRLRNVISAIWFEGFELTKTDIRLRFYTPTELENLNAEKREELLPQIAKRLEVPRKVCYGRETEIDQLARAIKSSFGRNVLLVGPSGVGKTNLVWELASRKNKLKIKGDIWETTASTMIKELTRDTGWQDNLAYLCRELSRKGDMLFVRNFLELFEVGQYEGNSVSMADYMRTYISRGEVNLITECTEEEFARIEVRSPNYIPLFQVIRLEEPKEKLDDIIIKKVEDVAHTQGVSITAEAIAETIRLNKRYTPYSGFPGKPIRFLESILLNQKSKDREQTKAARKKISTLINRSTVIQHFCEETGMPSFMIDPSIPMNPETIVDHFRSNIFGQEKAVSSTTDLLTTVKTALSRQGKPIASCLFVGPTGVGKTEMAKVLAEFMFGNRNKMIRFDMSEYSNPWSVQRLTGESYFKDGILTSAVRREPFSVILFDEIEKAHPVFYDLLLQILGEGRLTDSAGKLVNFCSAIIIMTSNIGARNLQTDRIGWNHELDTEEVSEHFMSAVQKHFRPELFNRIDKVIAFQPLSREVVGNVVKREIVLLRQREGILHRKMDFYLDPSIYEYLAEKGYDPKYGARQLQRALREEIILPLAKQLNLHEYDDQLVVNIKVENGKPEINIEADPLGLELLLEELNRNEWTDHVNLLRQSIYKLREGRFFIRLLSELDLMERDKKRLGQKFWERKEYAQKYGYFLDTKERLTLLTKSIESFEMSLALACVGLEPYNTNIHQEIKAWEFDYLNFKLELYTRLEPSASSCSISIYGSDIQHIYNIYKDILEEKGYGFKVLTILYRESFYNEKVEVTKTMYEDENIDTRGKMPGQSFVRKKYILGLHTDIDAGLNESAQVGDRVVGVIFRVTGLCAHMYFSGETGMHLWEYEKKKYQRILVACAEEEGSVPEDIHRKKSFDNIKARRTYGFETLHDTEFKIKFEVPRRKYTKPLIEHLDRRFSKKLDRELI
ncbi:MAG: AAA family ATPase [Bacteroidota bacterium]